MTIQNQEIEEVKASFGVNAEVADAIDKKAVAPGKVQKNGDQEPESIPQGSSLPKTKISMINAVMSKLSQMKKEDVEQQLASMEEDELDEAKLKRKRGPYVVTVHYHPVTHGFNGQRQGHTGQFRRPVEKKRILVPDAFSGDHAISHVEDLMRKRGHDVVGIKLSKNQDQREEYELDEDEQIDEARSEPVDITFETRRGKTENQQEVEHAARYEKSHGVKSKFADGPNGRTVSYSHSDSKKVKGALIKHHGGEDVSHIKIKEAYGVKNMNKRLGETYKITREDIDVSEDIAAAFSGSDLSEEFKAQATQIFETAVVSSVNMKLAEMAEQAEEEYAEEMQNIEEGLTTKIDEYLDYVVEQWMEENRLAVESGLRSEVTENFLSGLRNLFAENWIDIPEEKVEVVEELASEVEHITASLDEEMQKNIELKKQVEKFEREIAFVEVSEGLTEMQIAKFESLAEAVDYEDAESYKENLETIRMSFFENRSQEVMESRSTLDEEFIETYETSEKRLEPNMQVYSAAISRSVKK